MTLAAGTVLLERFRVVAERAGGAVELLDAVEFGAAERRVLIATLGVPSPSGEDPGAIVERAARYAAGFSAIARPIAASWAAEGRALVAYPSEAGASLDELIAARPEPAELAELVRALGRALGALHDQGVAHGALRPELIVRTTGGVSVRGFGIAELARALTGSARDAVPRVYRGPEWSSADARADVASDVYALGVIIAELIAGRRAREGDRPTPRGLGADPSDELEAALAGAVHAQPAERPRSIERWADEVGRLLALQPAPALPAFGPGPVEVEAVPPPVEAALPPVEAAPPPVEAAPPFHPASAPVFAPPVPRVQPAPSAPIAPPELLGDAALGAAPPARDRSWLITVFVLIGGALLMAGGIVAAVGFALRRAPASGARTAKLPAPAPFVLDAGAGGGTSGAAPGDDGGVASGAAPVARAPYCKLPPSARVPTRASGTIVALPVDRNVPTWGPADAPVTLLVFGDFECPQTRREYPALSALKAMFGDELRLAWRSRPEPSDAHATTVAVVAAAVYRELGARAFWSFAGAALTSHVAATPALLDRWAVGAGAARGEVTTWLSKAGALVPVDADLNLANRFDVRGTPTMFINGIRANGYQPYSVLRKLVERELHAARAARAAGVAADAVYGTRVEHNLLELSGDSPERRCPSLAGAPARGASNPLVTIVEFGDFQCPYCRRVEPEISELMKRYPKALRVVWKNFPLPFHSRARAAARFALEALARGGTAEFWRAHDLLLRAKPSLDDAELARVAKSAGLDAHALLAAERRGAHSGRIDADFEQGKKLGVDGSPTFFVNGRRVVGAVSLSRFESIVHEEVERAHRLLEAGTPPNDLYHAACSGS